MRWLAHPARGARRGQRLGRGIRCRLLIAALAAAWFGLLGCSEEFSGAEDTLGDTAERIERLVLPPIVDETEAMLRNYLNFLPVLLEVCATPVGALGDFSSQLPELQRAQQQSGETFTLEDLSGSWRAAWRDVVFGSQNGQGAEGIDVTLIARFRNAGLAPIGAVPFHLPADEGTPTGRDPDDLHACTASTPEGFYLFQDRSTGVWTLGWCAQGESKVFQGEINAPALSRVSRKVSSAATETVDSLSVNTSSTSLEFADTTAPLVAAGIRFFARPGELVEFQLSMGPAGEEPSSITRGELRLGTFNANVEQLLPAQLNPGEFELVTALPIASAGQPDFALRQDFATFIWRDESPGPCTAAGETLWHVRMHADRSVMFSGFVAVGDDDEDDPGLRVFRVGQCQEGLFEFEDGDQRLNYECVVDDASDNGYDVCVSGARRLQFSPAVEEVRDPTRVWIGAGNARAPAQDPHTMFYEIEMEEPRSARHLELTNVRVALLSTTEEGNEIRLRSDQVSLEALCNPLDDGPAHVRLIGNGEYATERFEGSRFEFDELDFTDGLRTSDISARRLPDRGELELRTRNDEDAVEITAPMSELRDASGRVVLPVDLTLTLDTLELEFLDREVNLSLE